MHHTVTKQWAQYKYPWTWKMILMSPCLLSLDLDDHFPTVRTWEVMNLPFKQYYHVRRLRISYDCRNIAPDNTYGHTKNATWSSSFSKGSRQRNQEWRSKERKYIYGFFCMNHMVQIPRTVRVSIDQHEYSPAGSTQFCLTPTTMVKHHTAYYPHGYANKWII